MMITPFPAKTPESMTIEPGPSEPRRSSMTRRPWLIRCFHRNSGSSGFIPLSKRPERSSPNDYTIVSISDGKRLSCSRWLGLLVMLCGTASSVTAATPEEILRAYGLQRVEKSWLVTAEVELHDRVEELGKLERRLQDAKRECDAQILAIEQLRAQFATAEATKKRLASVLKTAPAGQLRTLLERDQKEQTQLAAKLKEALPPADTLGGLAPLKGALAEQCALRAEFVLGYLEAYRLEAGLGKMYAELADKREIRDALAELPSQTLGPAKRLAADQKALQKFCTLAYATSVPFYREGKRVRMGVVLNEELPATLSWHDEHDATLLPYSAAQNLGLVQKLPPKQEQLSLAKEKQPLNGWFTTLDRIRVGQAVTDKATVFIMAPEHEALGGRLGYQLQQDLLLTLEAERLQIKCGLKPKSSDVGK